MSFAIVMPQLGLTMEEGTVSGWLKEPGDAVRKNEPLFSVSTDKVEMDVESAVDGILDKIIVPVGITVKVGTVLAYVNGGDGENITAISSEPPDKYPEEGAELHEVPTPPKLVENYVEPASDRAATQKSVSPRARRLAKELGV